MRTRQVIIITIMGVLFIGLVSLWAIGFVAQNTAREVGEVIGTVLDTTHESVLRWADETQQVVHAWALSPQVLEQFQDLLTRDSNGASLANAPAQRVLAEALAPAVMDDQNQGYFLVNLQNVILGASQAGEIGSLSALDQSPELFARLLSGGTFLSLPRLHNFSQEDGASVDEFTILVGAPIEDGEGLVIGALVFYIDPLADLASILDKGRLGETGETYMVDASGRFLSQSRFHADLPALGLLAAGESEILNLRVADPGVSLLDQADRATPLADRPLTAMAQSLVGRARDTNVGGYRDYRGVEVVGAWEWDADYGFGLATEIDRDQAFSNLGNVNLTVFILAGLSALALVGAVLITNAGEERERIAQKRYELTVEGAREAIISFDSENCVTAWNRQAEIVFGWTKREVLGRDLTSRIMPADTRQFYTGRLQEIRDNPDYFTTQQSGEVDMLRRDGSRFPADVILVPFTLSGEEVYSSIIRDLSDLKEAQRQVQRANADLTQSYDDTLRGWSNALDLRDNETEGHTQRVTEVTMDLARALKVPQKELVHYYRGALLHDIGKIGIPDQILRKPGPLDEEEWVIMKQHPSFAYNLLKDIPYLKPALEIPYYHHEKWDGSGYPHHLKGKKIPYAARLFAVVDVWDALSSDRPYRKAWPQDKVLDYLREQSGQHFDPEIVPVFLDMIGG